MVSAGEVKVDDKGDRIMGSSNKPLAGQKGGLGSPGAGEEPHADLSQIYSKGETRGGGGGGGEETCLGFTYVLGCEQI